MSWFTSSGRPGTSTPPPAAWCWTAGLSSTFRSRTSASPETSTGTRCCVADPRARWWLWSGSSRTSRSWPGCGAGSSPRWWWWTRAAAPWPSWRRRAWPRCWSARCTTRSRRRSASYKVTRLSKSISTQQNVLFQAFFKSWVEWSVFAL